ncbi:hypothetical protein TGRH88_086000 [Toxoplasma gondii]|uniref:Uncharacterized protein n=1 Tax=Toxoplasma gondii TaxID=5811 RepID=A0A7J6KIG6_TOXGO|nr:hypothetical protein TGRH88_086000 [Toxoplasma gondii]
MCGAGALVEDPVEELRLVISYVHSLCPSLPMAAIGLSLGGNTLLRLLSPLSAPEPAFSPPGALAQQAAAATSASVSTRPSGYLTLGRPQAPVQGVYLQPTLLPPACCSCCDGDAPFPCATTLARVQRAAARRVRAQCAQAETERRRRPLDTGDGAGGPHVSTQETRGLRETPPNPKNREGKEDEKGSVASARGGLGPGAFGGSKETHAEPQPGSGPRPPSPLAEASAQTRDEFFKSRSDKVVESEDRAGRRNKRDERRGVGAAPCMRGTAGLPFPRVAVERRARLAGGACLTGPAETRDRRRGGNGREAREDRAKAGAEVRRGASATSLSISATGAAALSYLGGLWSFASSGRTVQRPEQRPDVSSASMSRTSLWSETGAEEAGGAGREPAEAASSSSALGAVFPPPGSGRRHPGRTASAQAPLSLDVHAGEVRGDSGRGVSVPVASILSAVVCVGPFLEMHRCNERRNASFAGLFDWLSLTGLATDGIVSWLHGLVTFLSSFFERGATEGSPTPATSRKRGDASGEGPDDDVLYADPEALFSFPVSGSSLSPPNITGETKATFASSSQSVGNASTSARGRRWLAAYAEALFFEGAPWGWGSGEVRPARASGPKRGDRGDSGRARQPLLACQSSFEVDCWLAENALRLDRVELLSPYTRAPGCGRTRRRPARSCPRPRAGALRSPTSCAEAEHVGGRGSAARGRETRRRTRRARAKQLRNGGVSEFYEDWSVGGARLDNVPVPTLIFMSMDDPISDFGAVDLFACCRNANVAFAITQTGSHCTHLAGSRPRVWFARAAVEFLTKALTSCTWPLPSARHGSQSEATGQSAGTACSLKAGSESASKSPRRRKW